MTSKENFEEEFKRSAKPLYDKRNFLKLVIDNYQHSTNCSWGWVLYDWLLENGHIPDEEWKPSTSNVIKSKYMDELIAGGKLTIEQIKTYINK